MLLYQTTQINNGQSKFQDIDKIILETLQVIADFKYNPNGVLSQASANSANKEMHVLQCHGEADPLVPIMFRCLTMEKLKTLCNPSNITFNTVKGILNPNDNN